MRRYNANLQLDLNQWLTSLRAEFVKVIVGTVVAGFSLVAASFAPILRPLLHVNITINATLLASLFLVALLLGGVIAYFRVKPRVAKLRALAGTDELTSLFNSREFKLRLDAETRRASRYQEALSIILIDLDSFKAINDDYGYETGDSVLKELAEIIRREIRDTDIPFRYKLGDEFAVLLPNTTLVNARVPAERLRGRIERYRFGMPSRGAPVGLTISAGVVSLRSSGECIEGISVSRGKAEDIVPLVVDQLQRRAEKMLGDAKKTRNAVIIDEPA